MNNKLIKRFFVKVDNTAFGQFVRERAQSFVAINSSIADMGYILYAFSANEHLSKFLVCGMIGKISGSTILLADDKKGAAASRENRWPSKAVLTLHHAAKGITNPFCHMIPQQIKNRLLNPFSAAFSLYAFNGLTYFVNGCEGLTNHAALTDFSQTAAGVTMMLGGLSFAISGLERNKGTHEKIWSARGQKLYAITPIFCVLNLMASLASGNIPRSFALMLITSMATFQIYVRYDFKRQRNLEEI